MHVANVIDQSSRAHRHVQAARPCDALLRVAFLGPLPECKSHDAGLRSAHARQRLNFPLPLSHHAPVVIVGRGQDSAKGLEHLNPR